MTTPTDLRQGGTWTRAQSLKNDFILLAVKGGLAVLVPMPARALHAVGRAIGWLAYALGFRVRRAARSSVALVLAGTSPGEQSAIVRRSYVALGGHLGDALASLDPRRALVPLPVEDGALELLERLRVGPDGEPRGVLFASAHLGPWERVAATLVARGVPMTVLARDAYDPRLASIYDRLRDARGVRAIYRGHPGAPARIVRTLRTGGVLAVPMDLRSRVPCVEVDLLGRPTAVPVGPARIALRMGVSVVVGTVAPDPNGGGGLRIRCTEIPTDDLVRGQAGERDLTARIAVELSARIRAVPDQWVWMHDRFALGAAGVAGAAAQSGESPAPEIP